MHFLDGSPDQEVDSELGAIDLGRYGGRFEQRPGTGSFLERHGFLRDREDDVTRRERPEKIQPGRSGRQPRFNRSSSSCALGDLVEQQRVAVLSRIRHGFLSDGDLPRNHRLRSKISLFLSVRVESQPVDFVLQQEGKAVREVGVVL